MKVICNDGTVRECAPDEELRVLRHSAAHIMAQAVSRLYPGTHFAYGPATETGFYYDIDPGDHRIGEADLPVIEKEMRRICKEICPSARFPCPEKRRKNCWRSAVKSISWSMWTTCRRMPNSTFISRAIISTCAPARTSPAPQL